MTETVERVDVLIAGGGYVGLSAALAIAASVPGARVALVDPRPWREASGDGRAFAAGAVTIVFAVLTLWLALYPYVMPASNDPANSLTIANASTLPA